MNGIIELSSEVLIDRSQVHNPYLQLMLIAFGQELVRGSPWIAVSKQIAATNDVLLQLINGRIPLTSA
jgi:hypothetical protein